MYKKGKKSAKILSKVPRQKKLNRNFSFIELKKMKNLKKNEINKSIRFDQIKKKLMSQKK